MAFSIDTLDKLVNIIPGSNLLNLSSTDIVSMFSTPLATAGEDKVIHAVGVLHNSDIPEYSFYIENVTDRVGWDVTDCIDVEEVRIAPPSAPVAVTLADKYTVVAEIPSYSTPTDAESSINKSGTLPAGEYFVFADDQGMKNLSPDNQHEGVWINPEENVIHPEPEPIPEPGPNNFIGPRENSVAPEPVPEPVVEVSLPEVFKPSEVPIGNSSDTKWKATYKQFNPGGTPDTYELLIDYRMLEYGGKRSFVDLTKSRDINVVGTFTKNGVKFYRPRDYKKDVTFEWFYGIPVLDDNNVPIIRKVVDETPIQRFSDLWRVWKNDLRNYLGDKPVWDIFIHKDKGAK